MAMWHKSYASLGPKQKRSWRDLILLPRLAKPAYKNVPMCTRRTKFVCAALLIVMLVWTGLLLFHPYFRIRYITITGTKNINVQDIRNTAEAVLSKMYLYVIPSNNFFFLDRHRFETVLKTKFPIETISITKYFPNTISVAITERLAFVILDDGSTYTLVDDSGIPQKTLRSVSIHERKESNASGGEGERSGAPTTTMHYPDVAALHASYGTYPVLYNKQGNKIDLSVIKSAITISTYLEHNTDFATHHFIYPNEYKTLIVTHRDGIQVAFNPFERLTEQLETLRHAWQNELRKKKHRKARINARYPGRVFVEDGTGDTL